MSIYIIIGAAIALILGIGAIIHHQWLLKERAYMIREALKNRDFTFRLPAKGLLFGERELQNALNEMGQEMRQLVAENEVEAWERLTRVLTHEIMNAVAPISSISQAYLNNPKTQGSDYEEGIRAIYNTSLSLTSFVDSYRKLTQLQEPVAETIRLLPAVESVAMSYQDIKWNISIPQDFEVTTDRNLLRQVLANIVKNAVEAGATTIDVRQTDHLLISNNGAPIMPEARNDLFVPFFTTKKTGSGIGLSLSRQIMIKQGHNITIADQPELGYSVTFVINWKP